jgi:GAF domain-containing protein
VIETGKVEIIPDVLEDPKMQMTSSSLVRIRAALGVPMLRDNKVEGVLVLTRPKPRPIQQKPDRSGANFCRSGGHRRRECAIV